MNYKNCIAIQSGSLFLGKVVIDFEEGEKARAAIEGNSCLMELRGCWFGIETWLFRKNFKIV